MGILKVSGDLVRMRIFYYFYPDYSEIESVRMKKIGGIIILCVSLMLVCGLGACSSDNSADAISLLQTVPSDAGVVGVVNGKKLLEKAGGKIAEGLAVPGKDLEAALAEAVKQEPMLSGAFSGEAGIDPTVMVVFTEGYFAYLTGTLTDAAAFEKYCSQHGETLADSNGLKASRGAAVAGNQFWISLNGSAIDPLTVKGFTQMSENQSWASKSYASQLAESDDAICWAADAGALLRMLSENGFKQASTVRMAISAAFKDATYLLGKIDFEKGKAEVEMKVADSSFKPAEFLLPLGKVDPKVVEALDCSASVIGAVSVPSKLIKQVDKLLPGGIPAMYVDALAPIDGTVALASDSSEKMNLAISVNSKPTTSLVEMLQNMVPGLTPATSNKILTLKSNGLTGKLPASEYAKDFKGASAGFVVNPGGTAIHGVSEQARLIDRVSVMLNTEGRGLEVEIKLYAADRDNNFLKAAIAVMTRK